MISRRKLLLTALAAPAAAAAAQVVPDAPTMKQMSKEELRELLKTKVPPKYFGTFEVNLEKFCKHHGVERCSQIPALRGAVSITTGMHEKLNGELIWRRDWLNCFSSESFEFMKNSPFALLD